MSKKAVYNNKGLAIYIYQEDFETLIGNKYIVIPVTIGKSPDAIGALMVEIQESVRSGLVLALKAERQAIQEIQDQFAKDHPDYVSSKQVQLRGKRAKRRLR